MNLLLSDYEKKLTSWASVGLLVFVSAFLWAPSRDGLQVVFFLSFFLPGIALYIFHSPKRYEYLNYTTIIALTYGFFSLLSTLWGDPDSFGHFFLQWVVLAVWLFGASIVICRSAINIQKCIFGLLILGCLTIISTIIYYYFVYGISNAPLRIVGWNVFRNPNEFGSMCGIITLLAVIGAFQAISLRQSYFYYLLAVIGFIGLVLSFSRAAILAFFITALLSLIIIRPSVKVWLPPVSIILIGLVWFMLTNGISDYYTEGRGTGLSSRLIIWNDVLNKSINHMFTGIGMSENTNITIDNVGVFNHAHNAWVDTYYRTGIIGLFLIVCHLAFLFRVSFLDKKILPFFLWLLYGCVCIFFDGRCFFWEIGAKWFLYWIPAGLIVAFACSKHSVAK